MTVKFFDLANNIVDSSLSEFLRCAVRSDGPSRTFKLASQLILEDVMRAPKYGLNYFGPDPQGLALQLASRHSVRQRLELYYLPFAYFSPQSHLVLSNDGCVFQAGMVATNDMQETFRFIAGFDPLFRVGGENGRVDVDQANLESCTFINKIAVPICGPGFPNFGHFLYDGLGMALLIKFNPAYTDDFVFVGSSLSVWQDDILVRLGVRSRYVELQSPTRFRGVVASTMLYGHVPYPTRYLRPVFDLLAASIESSLAEKCDKVFLSRGDSRKRRLVNRLAVENALSDYGFLILDPLQHKLDHVAEVLCSARVVVGEAGAGMANIGFCEGGAHVLEIQPSSFVDGWTRATCAVFGLHWSVYVAPVDDAFISNLDGDFSYTLDLDLLRSALTRVLGTELEL